MRSWVYLIEVRVHHKDKSIQNISAVYVVALPEEQELQRVDMECYASEYLPQNLALSHGKAYAVGVDWELKNPEEYGIKGFREDLELYVFEEGLDFEEGLFRVYRIILDRVDKGEVYVEPVIDVGAPSKEVMYKSLKRALSA
ncbi:MAG: hypothetical protein D6674_05480 [Acidobacteria bacterium]|jgi:hypothetical protein|nr:MAG: hypothetical protein D6674_05480 [Acidobacteriota bacterium]